MNRYFLFLFFFTVLIVNGLGFSMSENFSQDREISFFLKIKKSKGLANSKFKYTLFIECSNNPKKREFYSKIEINLINVKSNQFLSSQIYSEANKPQSNLFPICKLKEHDEYFYIVDLAELDWKNEKGETVKFNDLFNNSFEMEFKLILSPKKKYLIDKKSSIVFTSERIQLIN